MEIYEGSGNVFADLGLPNPEERQAKAHLANLIEDIIQANGWTQVVAAEHMGLAQSDVSDIVRGRLKRFTLDQLFRCLNALDQDIEIIVRPKRPDRSARVLVGNS